MSGDDRLPGLCDLPEPVTFTPTRAAGLARLDRFVARAGRHYASLRNHDFGPDQRGNVSALSPWLRHRLLTEEEVLRATLARHSVSGADKFVQEVFWRTYFKGWMEQRPSVWTSYRDGVVRALDGLGGEAVARYQDAVTGRTGINGFDHWAQELVATGYLHNHARMWFASIWIFTLRLPWELGADFFLRHLMDGDPASNTLGWRWVGGLHTRGKTYLARDSNIARYTDGRFRPEGLSDTADALDEPHSHPRQPISPEDSLPEGDVLLLLTEEDGCAEALLPRPPAGVVGLLATEARSVLEVGGKARAFAEGALLDALARAGAGWDSLHGGDSWTAAIIAAAEAAGTRRVVTAHAPTGPVATRLAAVEPDLADAGITLHRIRRDYDSLAWPHATKGFFKLKQKIPQILRGLGLQA